MIKNPIQLNLMVKVSSALITIKKIFFILSLFLYSNLFAESSIKASNGIIWDKNNQSYTAEGNAKFKNEEVEAYADKILAYYSIEEGKEIFNKVNLYKNVKIIYQEEIFTSDTGVYDRTKNLIILNDNVNIVSPDRYLSGDELIVDLDKNTRVLKTKDGQDSFAEALIKDE